MVRHGLRAAFFLLTVLITTSCIVHQAVYPKPVTADDAREIALASFTSSEPVTVLSIKLTTIGAAMPGTGAADPSAPAWAVRLSGSFYDANICPADRITPPDCPAHTATAFAVIDARTHEFWGQRPAP